MSKKAIVLVSGGIDSAVTLAIAKAEGYELYAMSFFYGQKHRWELQAACKVVAAAGIPADHYSTIQLELDRFGNSALTDRAIPTPVDRTVKEMGDFVSVNYVPARNTVFLAYAVSYAEVIDADAIFLGVNALDYGGYPDCRPEYIEAYENMANLATRRGTEGKKRLRIRTPLIQASKKDIVQEGLGLGVNFANTSSCYQPTDTGVPCGHCDSCILRIQAFEELGLVDPLLAGQA